ncbi:Hypothetical predicted protein [Olea europaea subsp. europaea]|uniref:Uncharacterized protein n=1 Tax=Olea europaea subsp. europaea TaxID=158383 RepID=A0A8S0VET1_OLEEU|nr:Hypothetical predicted protein [Olea europaea subsp. europaea]
MLRPRREKSRTRKRENTNRGSSLPLEEPAGGVPPYDAEERNSSPDEFQFESDGSPLLDLRFPSTRGVRKIDMVDAFIMSDRTKALSRCRVDDVERLLAVYNRRVLTMQTSPIEASYLVTTELKDLKEEKGKEVGNLKKSLDVVELTIRPWSNFELTNFVGFIAHRYLLNALETLRGVLQLIIQSNVYPTPV